MMTLQREMDSLRSTYNSLSPASKTSSTRKLQSDEPRSRPQDEAAPFTAASSSETFRGPSLQKLPRPLMTQYQGHSRSTSQGEGHTDAYRHLQREALQHVYQPEQQAAFQRQQQLAYQQQQDAYHKQQQVSLQQENYQQTQPQWQMPVNRSTSIATETNYNADELTTMAPAHIKTLKQTRPEERLFLRHEDYIQRQPTYYQSNLPTTQGEETAFNYQYRSPPNATPAGMLYNQLPNQTDYFYNRRTNPVKTFEKSPYFTGQQDAICTPKQCS